VSCQRCFRLECFFIEENIYSLNTLGTLGVVIFYSTVVTQVRRVGSVFRTNIAKMITLTPGFLFSLGSCRLHGHRKVDETRRRRVDEIR
jgi:hypothetical protein